jgi:hypothetical protein
MYLIGPKRQLYILFLAVNQKTNFLVKVTLHHYAYVQLRHSCCAMRAAILLTFNYFLAPNLDQRGGAFVRDSIIAGTKG